MNYQQSNPYNQPQQQSYSNQHQPPPQQQYYASHPSTAGTHSNTHGYPSQIPPGYRSGGGGGGGRPAPYPQHSHVGGQSYPPTTQDHQQHQHAPLQDPTQQSQTNNSTSNPYEGGIFPPILLQSLDQLVDRLNVSSGYFPCRIGKGGGVSGTTTPATNPNASISAKPSSTTTVEGTTQEEHAPVQALFVGTNEGICLSRSFGTTLTHVPSTPSPTSSSSTTTTPTPSQPSTISNGGIAPMKNRFLSEEVLASLETIWSTLPSASPPHLIMEAIATSVAKATSSGAAATSTGSNGDQTESKMEENGGNDLDMFGQQPPHPFLAQLGLGKNVKVATAFYEDWTVLHVHLAPLVVTILTTPNANIGSIRSMAVQTLQSLLKPIRHAILNLRSQKTKMALMDSVSSPTSSTNAAGMMTNQGGGGQMRNMPVSSSYNQQHAYGHPGQHQQQTFTHQDLGIVYGSSNQGGGGAYAGY